MSKGQQKGRGGVGYIGKLGVRPRQKRDAIDM